MSLTPLDRNALKRQFDRAAESYDFHAVLQREIESRLLERIAFQRADPEVILDLGCGTASAGRELQARYPRGRVLSLDWSMPMLEKSRHGEVANGFTPICADMHALPLAPAAMNLVFSNLAIQWSYDLPAIFRELRRVMKADAMLVFSCYGPDTLSELKQSWRCVDDRQHVNDFPDMHDIGDELLAAGFREPVMDVERLTLQYPDVMSLLRELRGLGESNVAAERFKGLTAKSSLNRLLEAYERYLDSGRYPASFEIIYGTAFAPAEGQPMKTPEGDIATFSVDALRRRS